jgi:hypothetical protein
MRMDQACKYCTGSVRRHWWHRNRQSNANTAARQSCRRDHTDVSPYAIRCTPSFSNTSLMFPLLLVPGYACVSIDVPVVACTRVSPLTQL